MIKTDYIKEIDFSIIDWKTFEDICYDWAIEKFGEKNTEIIHTNYSGDKGKDIELLHNSKLGTYKAWIECKNHKRTIGLDSIGKNIVLVISKNIHAMIFMSTSPITGPAKDIIIEIGKSFGFRVSFFDDFLLKYELAKSSKTLKKYFPTVYNKMNGLKLSDILIDYNITEYEGQETLDEFVLRRNKTFYINVIIKNFSNMKFEDTYISLIDKGKNFYIKNERKSVCIEENSDSHVEFFCELLSYHNKKIKLPDIKLENSKYNIKLDTSYLDITAIQEFPYVGQALLDYKENKFKEILKDIHYGYPNVLFIYGHKGVGKSRFTEELARTAKHQQFSVKKKIVITKMV